MPQRSPPVQPIKLGRLPSEVVLRGGYLKQPVILTRLTTVEGKRFVYLWKGCPDLNRFLTGVPVCKRPLASCHVFEQIAEQRNETYRQKLADLKGAGGAVDDPKASRLDADGDAVESLGLDDTASKTSPVDVRNARMRVFKKVKGQVQRMEAVSIDHPGLDSWRPLVLMEPATKAPAMEATAGNFSALFALVDHELTHGNATKQERHRAVKADTRLPRGPPGDREYFVCPHSRPGGC